MHGTPIRDDSRTQRLLAALAIAERSEAADGPVLEPAGVGLGGQRLRLPTDPNISSALTYGRC